MKARVNIVTLGSRNLVLSRRFYEEGLGWKASSASNEHIVFFNAGGIVLALFPWDHLAADAQLPSAEEAQSTGFSGVTLAHNVEKPELVAEVLHQAEAAGAKIIKPAQDAFWGGRSGYFADPDGHTWEVAWNPHFPMRKDGSIELPA